MSGTRAMAAQDQRMRGAEDRRDVQPGTLFGRFQRRVGQSLESAARVFRLRHQASERAWESLEAEIRARALSRSRRHHLALDDAEDVASEACLRAFTLLTSPEAARIRHLEGYVHRLIDNLCKEQIRREKPVWSRLRAEVVETLRGRRAAAGFALWQHGALDLCGFALWKGCPIRWTERYAEVQQDIQPLRRFLSDRGISTSSTAHDLPALLAAVLDWVATPVPVNELTSLCFEVLGLRERTEEPAGAVEEAGPAGDGVEERSCRGLILRKVAEAFGHLNRAECAAFLFHLQPDVAEQLVLSLVPSGQADTAVGQMASGLRMSPAALEEALDGIPWSDLQIAAFLGVREGSDHSRQMYVINRRQRAMRVMRRSIERDAAEGDTAKGAVP